MQGDASGDIFAEGNLNLRVGVNGFRIDILVAIANRSAGNRRRGGIRCRDGVVERLATISPGNGQREWARCEGPCNRGCFASDGNSSRAHRNIGGGIIKGNRDRPVGGDFATGGRVRALECRWCSFRLFFVVAATAANHIDSEQCRHQ